MACMSANHISYKPFKPSQFTPKIRVLNFSQPTKLRSSVVRVYSYSESDKLPTDVRNRAIEAIDLSRRRVTIGDVVSKVSLDLNQAQSALQALAVDTDGFLEVSDEGDVVYVFPKDYRFKLVVKSVVSFRMMIEYVWAIGKAAALILYVIFIHGSWNSKPHSQKSDSDTNDRRLRSCNYPFIIHQSEIGLDPDEDEKLAISLLHDGRFLDCVVSMVFGDGDPNQGIEEKRWKMIGHYIAINGGVVAAEELTPYLDPKTTKEMGDESYMLPVLLRFGGKPEVNEEGHIIYHFPSLQSTASPQSGEGNECVGKCTDCVVEVEKYLKEEEWRFSKVDDKEMVSVEQHLVNNQLRAICWVIFIRMLAREQGSLPSIFYVVSSLLQMFVIYTISFGVIAMFRKASIQRKNDDIVRRNEAREQRAMALELPDLSLKQKLLSARSMARRTSIGEDRIVYSTERDLCGDYERDSWDQIFKRRWDFAV